MTKREKLLAKLTPAVREVYLKYGEDNSACQEGFHEAWVNATKGVSVAESRERSKILNALRTAA